jgi:predicted MFS family arabinose efflux permease
MAEQVSGAIASRAVVAAGCSVSFVTLMRYVKERWPRTQVATISGRGILVGNFGAIASAAPLAFVLGYVHWRTLCGVLGAVSLMLGIMLFALMPDGTRPAKTVSVLSVWREMRAVLANPYNHLGFLVLAGLSGAYYSFVGLWAVPMLTDKGMPGEFAPWCVSAMIAGYALGASILGWVGDRTRERGKTLVCACCGALALWALILASASLSPLCLGFAILTLGVSCGAFNLVYVLVTERNPEEHAGMVTSYINVGIFAGAATIQHLSTSLWSSSGQHLAVLPMAAAAAIALFASLALRAYQATDRNGVPEFLCLRRATPRAQAR